MIRPLCSLDKRHGENLPAVAPQKEFSDAREQYVGLSGRPHLVLKKRARRSPRRARFISIVTLQNLGSAQQPRRFPWPRSIITVEPNF